MLKSKEIKRLKERVNVLEERINAFLSQQSPKINTNTSLSYEEVITEWLCGKETTVK